MKQVLIAIDVQNDFCDKGALAVPDADAVVPVINGLLRKFELRVLTQDWHPKNHLSFASQHVGKTPFSHIDLPYGSQVLWPNHCVQGTKGAEFHKDLLVNEFHTVIRKGFHREIDSYSAFLENDGQTSTGLQGYLREVGAETIFLAGLATDFCVKYSALDGRASGFAVVIVEDACRGIDQDGSLETAYEELRSAGVTFKKAEDIN